MVVVILYREEEEGKPGDMEVICMEAEEEVNTGLLSAVEEVNTCLLV